MKKIVSLVLAMVLMASMFAMLGTLTASAETYEITKELVNLTFDGDAPYGVVAHRLISNVVYNKEGYVEIHNKKANGGMAFFGKDGTVGATPVGRSETDDISQFTAAQLEAYNNLFMFEAGKSYKITFDYKVLAGTTNEKAYPSYSVYSNPLLKTADPVRNLTNANAATIRVLNVSINVPRINYTLTDGVLAEDTDWATGEITFTTKDDETGFCFGLYAGYYEGKDSICAFDNFKVEEVLSEYTYTDSGVITMDEQLTWTNASNCPAEIVDSGDAAHGKVLKTNGSAGKASRGGFAIDALRITRGKKYFISFDAKTDNDGYGLVFGITRLSDTGSRRVFISGYNNFLTGVKAFADGTPIIYEDNASTGVTLTTEWKTYGFIIDATVDSAFDKRCLTYQKDFWGDIIHPMFGAGGVSYFDNIKVVAMSEPATSAVPEKDASAKYSIRKEAAGLSAGLRFKGDVDASVKAAADEIGFVVAPVELVTGAENWYKVDSLNKNAKKAVAYNGTKDVVYDDNGDTVSYQLVLTNLGNLASRRFAAVMYVKNGDTYTYISLGEISYNAVAAEYAVRGH